VNKSLARMVAGPGQHRKLRSRWLVVTLRVAAGLLVLNLGGGCVGSSSNSSGCPPIADPPYSWAPAWSPDGREIAFLRGDRTWDVVCGER
jgi:hypothetical protein